MTVAPLWIFGYGSLIWNPGFAVAERAIATLPGYARSFCMRSIHHRGSVARPGLVLALDAAPDTACGGVAFRVEPGAEAATLAALRERELISSAYLERELAAILADGRRVAATTYVVDRDHAQYAGALTLDEQAAIIGAAVGGRGRNVDYLLSTADHLADLNIADHDIEWLAARLRAAGRGGASCGVNALLT